MNQLQSVLFQIGSGVNPTSCTSMKAEDRLIPRVADGLAFLCAL